MKKDTSVHKDCGMIASKYVETLQRSNEQLVKVATILHKRTAPEKGLSDADRSELFDIINNSAPEE